MAAKRAGVAAPSTARVFEADVILPSQFWGPRSDARAEPEKRLMLAVLEDALGLVLLDARAPAKHRRAAVREASHWIDSDDRSRPFAFAAICDLLGIEIGRVRKAIDAMRCRPGDFIRKRFQAGRGRHRVSAGRRRAQVA